MRIKSYEDVYRDPSFIDEATLLDIENGGKSYNWIIANHYSLLNYINKHKLNNNDLLSTNILCRACVLEDKESPHFHKKVIKNNQTAVNTFETDFVYGPREYKFLFMNDALVQVNMLYLFKVAFDLNKSKILNTRLYESQSSEGVSNNSYKDFIRNKMPIDNDFTKLIKSGIKCKFPVFLFIECDQEGKDVPWYINLDNDESINISNALREYSDYIGRDKQKSINNYCNDEEINKILLKRKKIDDICKK